MPLFGNATRHAHFVSLMVYKVLGFRVPNWFVMLSRRLHQRSYNIATCTGISFILLVTLHSNLVDQLKFTNGKTVLSSSRGSLPDLREELIEDIFFFLYICFTSLFVTFTSSCRCLILLYINKNNKSLPLLFIYSSSSERKRALGLVNLIDSCWARSTMSFLFLLETLWAISAAKVLFCIRSTSNSWKIQTSKWISKNTSTNTCTVLFSIPG